MNPPRIWPAAVAAALGIVVLCGLGTWQLQRLAQKQALLAEVEQHGKEDPVGISEALKRRAAGGNVEFLKVSATGHYVQSAEKLMIGVFDGSPAWEVVTPLVTIDNTLILVDRGLVPDDLRDPARRVESRAPGEVHVTGILRAHDGKRGFFSPDNDVKANMWFWWDVPAMLASPSLPPDAKPAPFVLHVLPIAGQGGFPRPQAPDAGIQNHHLQYAVTWFSLALVLAVIAGLHIRGQMKKTGA